MSSTLSTLSRDGTPKAAAVATIAVSRLPAGWPSRVRGGHSSGITALEATDGPAW